jgi:hypothetical protein
VDETRERGQVRVSAQGGDLLGDRRQERPRVQGIQLFREPVDEGKDEVEFVTIMWFDSWEAVRCFAGEDYERAYVPSRAQEVLERFAKRSRHYEVKQRLEY